VRENSDLREKPIPEIVSGKSALDYGQIQINLDSEANKEPLVDVKDYGIAARSYYARANPPYYKAFKTALENVFLRDGVAQMLVRANNELTDYGLEIVVYDGFRPIALQHELWNYFMDRAHQKMPGAPEGALREFAGQFVSDPSNYADDDPHRCPVHNTGGAVDLSIRSLYDKSELFMGSIFDDADPISFTRHFESEALTSESAKEARRNRRLLYHVMSNAGFINYPYEWWHFDYGTQMWVMNGNLPGPALYGRAKLTLL
jgi:D-alanyl-D-alanine dipeptidase